MAEIILTRDTKTSGFMEDAELIIQFVIDQATLKMKIIGRKGTCLMNQCFDVMSYDKSDRMQESSVNGNNAGVRVFFGLNQFLHKFYVKVPEVPRLVHQSSGNVMNTLWRNFMEPMSQLFNLNTDVNQSVHQMVEQQGYEYNQFETETEDGYILQMSRVPNKMSFDVVFFMHGIFDKCWTWLCHGPGESIGYEARDAGYDVFLGNYRGVYPRKLAEWK